MNLEACMKRLIVTGIAALSVFSSPLMAEGFFDGVIRKVKSVYSSDEEREVQVQETQPLVVTGAVLERVSNLNVREYPSLNARVIKKIQGGQEFLVLPLPEDFQPVVYRGKTVWVSSDFCADGLVWAVKRDVRNLNFRETPGTNGAKIGKLQGGAEFTLIQQNEKWMNITLVDQGATGWIHSDYARKYIKIENVETRVNLREYPENGSNAVSTVANGALLQMSSVADNFIRVQLDDGTTGWIAKSFARIDNEEQAGNNGETQTNTTQTQRISSVVTKIHNELKLGELHKELSKITWRDKLKGAAVPKSHRIKMIFKNSPLLSREFADEMDNRYMNTVEDVFEDLVEFVNNPHKARQCGRLILANQFRDAVECAKNVNEDYDFPKKGKPLGNWENLPGTNRIVVDIPDEYLYVYRGHQLIYWYKIVVGQKDHIDNRGTDDNSKTRVGDFKIIEWIQGYSNDSYPSWNDDKMRGAFGKYTAKLNDSHGQYIHGTYGDGFVDWVAIAVAPGSHGCVRCQNDDIELLSKICPVGTKVEKRYTLHQLIKKGDDELKYKESRNRYDYQDVQDTGYFYPATGVFVNYKAPQDAVTD
jgi:uncharacterized protein YgiM (DUF1202 family)/lipoprotein-anchoring transpeptidase ErfK/SrfK